MPSVKPDTTIREYQEFVKQVYGLPNDRYFTTTDMIANIERFSMRALKGIRQNNKEKTRINLLISSSWFMSLMNQLHIDIEQEIWKRFPYLCSYCASCPCICKKEKVETRKQIPIDENKRPKTFEQFQEMLNQIYPAEKRTLEKAGVHLAEEIGEFSEAILTYRGKHKDEDFKQVVLEAADLFTHFLTVSSSMNMSIAKELSIMFYNNCHVCKNAPCTCNFIDITRFES